MASAARIERQLDHEFIVEKLPTGSLFKIKLENAKGAVIPVRLQGVWTSEAKALEAIEDWRDSLAKRLPETVE